VSYEKLSYLCCFNHLSVNSQSSCVHCQIPPATSDYNRRCDSE